MEIDEVAARVVRSYWALLLVMTVLPMLLVGYVMSGQTPPYAGKSRLQATSKATDAAPGDAGVSIVVSQVKAFATSHNLLQNVLQAQHVDRNADKVAKQISVTGLGTSTVVELSVKDRDATVARKLTDAIGTAVVDEINESNQGSINSQLKDIDKRVRDLEKRLGPLAQKAGQVPVPDIAAGNERERVQAELTDLRDSRSELRTQLSAAGEASVVQPAVLAPRTNPVVMMAAIGGLVGLIAGILIAVVMEMVRPTIPGQGRVAKRLGVPLLGWVDRTDAELADLGRRIRLSAKRAGVTQVTLVNAGREPLPAELISKVAAAVYGDETKLVTARAGAAPGAPKKVAPKAARDDDDGSAAAGANGQVKAPGKDGGTPKDGGSTSVVRAGKGSSVMTKQSSGEVVSPTDVTQPVQPVMLRAQCHVHAFEDIDPGSDDEVGVVAVAGPVTLISDLESVQDLVTAAGWPLLGVAAASKKIKG
ncbi:hypothetical protein J4573_14220 [Actinomadura barringtoniae]|uniref:Polysaccharide chain length determinant N-terminal domain-containing protein n=1 Tax=Actinomadura barringtoniae TaxID=1427535 RepID=A0A939P950_9ACTN|nr:hypothetical protein [Actinomadura barringtoniae]MBO2448256.1 hypothetical protein [Actinomadura barringtoniae]